MLQFVELDFQEWVIVEFGELPREQPVNETFGQLNQIRSFAHQQLNRIFQCVRHLDHLKIISPLYNLQKPSQESCITS